MIKNRNRNRNKALIHKPYKKFKTWLFDNDLTYNDIAKTLSLSIGTVSQKVNGHSDFYSYEINFLLDKYMNLGITYDIFLLNSCVKETYRKGA